MQNLWCRILDLYHVGAFSYLNLLKHPPLSCRRRTHMATQQIKMNFILSKTAFSALTHLCSCTLKLTSLLQPCAAAQHPFLFMLDPQSETEYSNDASKFIWKYYKDGAILMLEEKKESNFCLFLFNHIKSSTSKN